MLSAANRIAAKIVSGFIGLMAAITFTRADIQPIGIAFLLLGPALTVLIHELGHAGAAWALGMHVRSIAVGPFAFYPHPPRFGPTKRMLGRDVGGFVEYDDTRGRYLTRKMDRIIIAAGPLANLATVFMVFPLAGPFADNTTTKWILGGLGFASIAAFVASAWPYRLHSGIPNDALKLLKTFDFKPLFKRKPKRSSWQAR